MSDDYGFYGKGFEGYSHYMQEFDGSNKGSSGGGPRKNKNGNNNAGGCIVIIVLALLIYAIVKAILES